MEYVIFQSLEVSITRFFLADHGTSQRSSTVYNFFNYKKQLFTIFSIFFWNINSQQNIIEILDYFNRISSAVTLQLPYQPQLPPSNSLALLRNAVSPKLNNAINVDLSMNMQVENRQLDQNRLNGACGPMREYRKIVNVRRCCWQYLPHEACHSAKPRTAGLNFTSSFNLMPIKMDRDL